MFIDRPLISVIIPVYKVEKTLRRCVDSVRSQSYRELDIILVDDGSPDRCGDICDELATEDSRIRVIHKENGGLSSARNAGLALVRGKYVGFVDSDDWIESRMYQELYERMVAGNAQISVCRLVSRTQDGRIRDIYPNSQVDSILSTEEAMLLLCRNRVISDSVCNKLYEAALFAGLQFQSDVLYEDTQIQPRLISRAARIAYTATPLYYYCINEISITRPETYGIKQYDAVRFSKERILLAAEYFPSCVSSAKAAHIEILLQVIYSSYGIDEWDSLRQDMLEDLAMTKSKQVLKLLGSKTRLKMWLVHRNVQLYAGVMRAYLLFSGIWRRMSP